MTAQPPASSRGQFAAGFRTLTDEVTGVALPVTGRLPGWLAGSLVRNGPALFDPPSRPFRHWFDGLAMLHRFAFDGSTVSYTNRLLDTPASRAVREQGRIGFAEFATDPCASLFGRFVTRFRRKPTSNAVVNVARLGEQFVALTETPLPVEFDPVTLRAAGVVRYTGEVGGVTCTAHPHADPVTGGLVNVALALGRRSEYRVYRQTGLHRELLATVPAQRPGYLHSFACTERDVVLVIFPLVVHPLSFVLRGRPFIENYRWRPELGTRVVVIDSASCAVRADTTTATPCFAFHHINAYQVGGELVIDLSSYPDAGVIDALYLDRLRANGAVPMGRPTRLTVSPDTGEVRIRQLSAEPLELPRIADDTRHGRRYRYVYGCGAADAGGTNFLDQLVKLDVETGQAAIWRAAGCHPGEPVFVPAPDGAAEDAGVVLSVVLDVVADTSFLLVLDASTFTELARAVVPHAVPFGFHGQFDRTC